MKNGCKNNSRKIYRFSPKKYPKNKTPQFVGFYFSMFINYYFMKYPK